jgi:hypothetical protein
MNCVKKCIAIIMLGNCYRCYLLFKRVKIGICRTVMILRGVLYGGVTWSLTLKEEGLHKLQAFEEKHMTRTLNLRRNN